MPLNTETRPRPLVLVADDDPEVRAVLRGDLEHAGFDVEEVGDGREAVAAFARSVPDAVLMDVVMPIMDGFEACAEIRRIPEAEAVPIVMLTGLADAESIRRAFEAGGTDYVTKPSNWLVLTHRLKSMLGARRNMEDLRRSEARLASAQKAAQLGYWDWEPSASRLFASTEMHRLVGAEGGRLQRLEEILARVHPEDRDRIDKAVTDLIALGRPFALDHRLILPGGDLLHVHHRAEAVQDRDGRIAVVTATVQNITERIVAEQRVQSLVLYDTLTGLPNSSMFKERLSFALGRARRHLQSVAVLFLDVDQFRRINDTLGHSAGDELLEEVATRLSTKVRISDTVSRSAETTRADNVARLGGDEFILLLPEVARGEDASKVARRALESLREPFRAGGREVFITASIGISLFPLDGQDVDSLLKNAEVAMYHAKNLGRNNYQFYNDSMNASAFHRLALETGLRKALARNEFVLHFQPQVDTADGRIIGAEALVRWSHPDLGMVAPADFIPLAEETGLILPIGEWVVQAACSQGRAWEQAGHRNLRIAINLSGQQLQEQALPGLLQAVRRAGFDPSMIELELTESVLMGDAVRTVRTIREFKEMGVRISIDDFGTGYSSLSYLRRFPIDALKIDRSFVRDITRSPGDAAITGAVVSLARAMQIDVVAEGVETPEQKEILIGMGCRLMQGYLFSRPVPPDELAPLLEKQTTKRSDEPVRTP